MQRVYMELKTIADIVRYELPLARMAHSDRQRIYNLLEQSLAHTPAHDDTVRFMHILRDFDRAIVPGEHVSEWSPRFQRAVRRHEIIQAFGEPPRLGSVPPPQIPKPKPLRF